MKYLCGVVIPARDEERYIEKTLISLISQTIRPFIVVVNDGSIDRTREIASRYADVIIDLPRHEESWTGKPQLARVFNAGFDILSSMDVDYVMISGAEAIYPPDYIEKITYRMRRDDVVIASGVAEGEKSKPFSPRGSGRVIEAKWFHSVGFKYPENYGFESYIVFKALSQNRKVAVYPDLKFKLQRKTTITPKKAYYWGKGMKALNYSILYSTGRLILLIPRSPRAAFAMLMGLLSRDVEKYSDISKFVPYFQRKQIEAKIRDYIGKTFKI